MLPLNGLFYLKANDGKSQKRATPKRKSVAGIKPKLTSNVTSKVPTRIIIKEPNMSIFMCRYGHWQCGVTNHSVDWTTCGHICQHKQKTKQRHCHCIWSSPMMPLGSTHSAPRDAGSLVWFHVTASLLRTHRRFACFLESGQAWLPPCQRCMHWMRSRQLPSVWVRSGQSPPMSAGRPLQGAMHKLDKNQQCYYSEGLALGEFQGTE